MSVCYCCYYRANREDNDKEPRTLGAVRDSDTRAVLHHPQETGDFKFFCCFLVFILGVGGQEEALFKYVKLKPKRKHGRNKSFSVWCFLEERGRQAVLLPCTRSPRGRVVATSASVMQYRCRFLQWDTYGSR